MLRLLLIRLVRIIERTMPVGEGVPPFSCNWLPFFVIGSFLSIG